MYARTRRPAALAPVITSLKRWREVAMSVLRFFCVNDSVAAAKTESSMKGGGESGVSEDWGWDPG